MTILPPSNNRTTCHKSRMLSHGILLLVVLLSSSLSASPPQFERLTVEDGLFSNRTTKTYKSSQGDLWVIGINGIARYDGYQFQNFTSYADDKLNYINGTRFFDIVEDQMRHIWVISNNGLHVYSQEKTHFESVGESQIKGANSLWLQEDTSVWLSCKNGVNYSINCQTRSITKLSIKGTVSAIKKDMNGHVWRVFKDGSIYKNDEKILSLSRTGRDLSFLPNGDLLVGTYKGLYLIKSINGVICSSSSFRKLDLDLSNEVITTISGQHDKIWLGTQHGLNLLSFDDNGILVVETTYNNVPADAHSLSNNQITDVYVDNEEIVWVSTYGGLNKLDESKQWFMSYKNDPLNHNSLYDNNVFPINGTTSGQVWFGTIYNGLSMLDTESQKFKPFLSTNDGPIPIVRSIYTDNTDRVWVAAGRNLYKADPSGLNKITILKADGSPFSFKHIKGIIKHSDGRFYLGIDGQIVRLVELDNESFQIEYIYDKQPGTTVCFYTDHLDRLWCATTNKGLLLLELSDDHDFIRFSMEQNDIFLTNEVQAIAQDLAGNLWLGTVNGLYCATNDSIFEKSPKDIRFKGYFVEDGLTSNYISNIISTPDGGLWLSSWTGIMKYSPNFPNIAQFTPYSFADGLVDDKYNRRASYYNAKTQLIYFGTPNGINYFKPIDIKHDRSLLQTRIVKILVDGEAVSKSLKIVHRGRIDKLAIDMVSNSLSSPEKRIFAWRMQGHSDTLCYVRDNHIELTGIKKGKYILYLSALNDNGILGPPFALSVVVKTPLKPIILIGATIIFLFAFFRKRKLVDIAVEKEKVQNTPKYEFSTLTPSDSKTFAKRLTTVMIKEKPYLNANLSAEKLAQMADISQGELSQVLSEYLGSNFYEFVNKYRVKEFMNLLTAPESQKYTILALSEKCGFSNRSTFYRAFKHKTGMTPAQYVKENSPK